jgi:predicted nucleic acid-binding protein
MTFLDAYALIAFFVGGPAKEHVRAILREGDAALATANLVEVLDVSERVHRVPISRTAEVLEPLLAGPLQAVPLDSRTAHRAAEIRAKHYDRKDCPISLADAVLLASASGTDRIATADPDLLAVAGAEGIDCMALPEPG